MNGFIILTTIFALWVFSAGGMIYAGAESGELQTRLVEPLKETFQSAEQFWEEMEVAINEEEDEKVSPEELFGQENASVSSESTVIINYGQIVPDTKPGNTQKIIWIEPTLPPQQSYTEYKKSIEDWWKDVTEANKKMSEQSQKDLENFRIQSQQNLEQFKLEGQQGLEQFRIDMQKEQEEFLKSHGINP